MYNVEGKSILVTGALGQLGRAYCTALAQAGARVIVSDVDGEACGKFAGELIGDVDHIGIPLDVGDPASVKSAFATIEEQYGTLDVLVNNAGIAVFTPFAERSFEDFMRVFRVNAGGVFLCTQAASALMQKNGTKGVIVNIGSIYGVVSSNPSIYTDCNRMNSECYSGSKAAIIHMTKYFAAHLAPYSIRVNCLSPGGVFNHQGEDFVENYTKKTPMARMGSEEDMARALLFLASRDCPYLTGHNLIVDGGFTAW